MNKEGETRIMAFLRIEYYSRALHRPTAFEMILPNDPREEEELPSGPMKTLFLLHGYTGKAENWVPMDLVRKYHFAIVMPNGENSFYLNGLSTGHAFQTLVGEELVDYCRQTFGLAQGPQDTFVAGLSMGGFGAIHTGLAYPDRFGKIGAQSSALIHHGVAQMQPGTGNSVANYEYYRECFGEPAQLEESENNPEVLVKKLKREGKPIPQLFLCCGTEDFLIEPNRDFHRFLLSEGVPHEYLEAPGVHDMKFWSETIVNIIDWMMK